MIAPAVTVSPANTFTPSRFAFESRPFLEEPSPFLCATAGCFFAAAGSAFLRGARGFLAAPIDAIVIRDSSERCPRVFLNPRFGLNVNTFSFSPRRCSTTSAVTVPFSFARSVTTASPPVISTSGVNVLPASSAWRSTRSFCPCSTRYCLPPTLITAYMLSVSTRKCPRDNGRDDRSRRPSLAEQPPEQSLLASAVPVAGRLRCCRRLLWLRRRLRPGRRRHGCGPRGHGLVRRRLGRLGRAVSVGSRRRLRRRLGLSGSRLSRRLRLLGRIRLTDFAVYGGHLRGRLQ